MKKLNENQLQNLEAGKFWGWSCGPEIDLPGGGGNCYRVCTYHILWIPNGTEEYGCNDLPGRYGR